MSAAAGRHPVTAGPLPAETLVESGEFPGRPAETLEESGELPGLSGNPASARALDIQDHEELT